MGDDRTIASKGTKHDPRGLIQESFRIPGISPENCRSIFLDWVLGLPDDIKPEDAIRYLLELYADEPAEHPMKEVLRGGLETRPPRRRTRRRRDAEDD